MVKRTVSSKKSKVPPQKEYVGVLLEDMNEKLGLVVEETSKIPKIEGRLDRIENNIEIMKTDLELIKGGLKLKVDLDDFQALERRVSRLESRS